MKKPNSICGRCRKIKNVSCVCIKPKQFDKINKSNYSFYNSREWRKHSHALRKMQPLCELCLKDNITTLCVMVDHIRPIDKGGNKWDVNNLQCLCKKCHNIKTGRSKQSI